MFSAGPGPSHDSIRPYAAGRRRPSTMASHAKPDVVRTGRERKPLAMRSTLHSRIVWAQSYSRIVACLILMALVLLMFGDVLFTARDIVASHNQYDAKCYFAAVRSFGFDEIRNGNLPLWNPYIYSGAPFVAGFQSALFYPLNLHYLVLPLAKSLNLEIVLHVGLVGVLMFMWACDRGLSTKAALFAAIVPTFSAPFFLHVMPGHLTMLGAMSWTPLAFMAVDRVLETRRVYWAFVGATAFTMTILAGHPQVVFCLLVALGPYAAIRWMQNPHRATAAARLAFLFGAPVFLAAAQLWPGIASTDESIRAGGMDYAVASSLSFPPENLLTFFAPTFFGDSEATTYWGRWVYWESCAFIGVTALSLAMYGVVAGRQRARYLWLGMALGVIAVSLGRYTPLHRALYAAVPGFDAFRCPTRHLFLAVPFLALLAGHGIDTLSQRPRRVPVLVFTTFACAIAMFVAAGLVVWAGGQGDAASAWARQLAWMHTPGESLWKYSDAWVAPSANHAVRSLIAAATTSTLLAVLYLAARRRTWPVYAMIALGTLELMVFARISRPSFDLASLRRPVLESFLHSQGGDFRVLDQTIENYPLEIRVHDMWGYDPAARRRYTQLVAYTQDARAETDLNEFGFKQFHPLYAMFRCEYVIMPRYNPDNVARLANVLPRALLIGRFRVIEDEDERIRAVADHSFDPRDLVVLESQPDPAPDPDGAGGVIRCIDESTDRFIVEVEAPRPSILLITDSYSKDWRATPLSQGPQSQYEILPANHALRAIPLAAGSHRIRVEYAPPSFAWGIRTSIVSLTLFNAAWIGCLVFTPRLRKPS